MLYRIFEKFWNTHKETRRGQCYGLLIIGMAFGLLGTLKTRELAFDQRAIYGLAAGVSLGLVLILTMVVPSMYLSFIRTKKAEGKNVRVHRVLLVLYFFPFLTYTIVGSIALVFHLFGS